MRATTSSFVVIGVLQAVCWIVFSLRLYARFVVLRKPSVDDLIVGLALITYTIFGAFAIGVVSSGLGTNVDNDPSMRDVWSRANFDFFISELAFVADGILLRCACAAMLLCILSPGQRRLRCLIWTTTGLMGLYSLGVFVFSLFQCAPVSYFWTYMYDDPHGAPGGSCRAGEHLSGKWTVMSTLFAVHSVVCCVSDWILGALPFFILRGVQISSRRKVLIIALLSLGISAGMVALIRTPFIFSGNTRSFWDHVVPVAVCAALEPALGIIAVCATALMPLFKRCSRPVGPDSADRFATGGPPQPGPDDGFHMASRRFANRLCTPLQNRNAASLGTLSGTRSDHTHVDSVASMEAKREPDILVSEGQQIEV